MAEIGARWRGTSTTSFRTLTCPFIRGWERSIFNGANTNPCDEIALSVLGGYCVIADNAPFHADTLDEAEGALRATTRALMRVNLMDSLYKGEVQRTNRIGVGLTDVHEFAWKFFQVGFRHMVNPDFNGWFKWKATHSPLDTNWMDQCTDPHVRAAQFWMTLSRFSNAVVEETKAYAEFLGVTVPHTSLTVKPAGTTSKLFGLTEGWHLPSMLEYLRWVQFQESDPLVAEYRAKGYPTRELKSYKGVVIVGFPTRPTICDLGIPDEDLVTAGEATPQEQYNGCLSANASGSTARLTPSISPPATASATRSVTPSSIGRRRSPSRCSRKPCVPCSATSVLVRLCRRRTPRAQRMSTSRYGYALDLKMSRRTRLYGC